MEFIRKAYIREGTWISSFSIGIYVTKRNVERKKDIP